MYVVSGLFADAQRASPAWAYPVDGSTRPKTKNAIVRRQSFTTFLAHIGAMSPSSRSEAICKC